MNFKEFLDAVPQLILSDLPALNTQLKMVPLERVANLNWKPSENKKPRTAAVLMLCYPKNEETHLVLIVRNAYNGVHSSQIAFPGGKYETEDADFKATALREAQEEVGIRPDTIEIIKPFTSVYISPSNFMVYPFLGISKEPIRFVPDPLEVADIIELPLATFLNEGLVVKTAIQTSYASSIVVPAYQIENHFVWGATAMMLSELKDVLKTVFKT